MTNPLTVKQMEKIAAHIPACDCSECQSMCDRPCWPTPAEARSLIDMGLRDRLMADYWVTPIDEDDIDIISPSCAGYEGDRAPFFPTGGCTFYANRRCTIHSTKPLEGRIATCNDSLRSKHNIHEAIAMLWKSEEGKAVSDLWHTTAAS